MVASIISLSSVAFPLGWEMFDMILIFHSRSVLCLSRLDFVISFNLHLCGVCCGVYVGGVSHVSMYDPRRPGKIWLSCFITPPCLLEQSLKLNLEVTICLVGLLGGQVGGQRATAIQ